MGMWFHSFIHIKALAQRERTCRCLGHWLTPLSIVLPYAEVSNMDFSVEGVCLTETGFRQISGMAMARTHKKSRRRSNLKIGSLDLLRSLADPNSDISKIADRQYDPQGLGRGKILLSSSFPYIQNDPYDNTALLCKREQVTKVTFLVKEQNVPANSTDVNRIWWCLT